MRGSPVSVVALCALACQSPEPRQEVRTPVPEGINDSFIARDVDVDAFVARWELESREVYVARHRIVDAMEIEPGVDVADIGAGTGLFAELLSRAAGPDGTVLAIDIAPGFVEHIEARVEREGLSNVTAVLSTDRGLGVAENSVDVALLCDVYHHFEYHEDMLRSIRRALRPGGMLVVVDFERIPGVTREWLLGHVRAGRDQVRREILGSGMELVDEPEIPGFVENYCMRFRN